MHRALQIYEILERTFTFLSKRDLAVVLQTCQAFFKAGIETLYEDVDSEACKTMVELCLKADPHLLFTDRLKRFHTYAKRVRRLDLNVNLPAFPTQFARIVMLTASDSLFPNLRVLRVHSADPDQMDFVTQLLSPRLEQLRISTFPNTGSRDYTLDEYMVLASSILAALPDRCQLLKVLELRVPLTSASHPPSPSFLLCHLLRKLQHLTELECDLVVLEPPALEQLARHPNIRKLHLGCTDYVYPHSHIFSPVIGDPLGWFSKLRRFSSPHPKTGPSATSLLNILPTTLLDLVLSLDTEELSAGDAAAVSHLIANRFTSLESCRLTLGDEDVDPSEEIWSMELFMELQGCVRMRSFAISFLSPWNGNILLHLDNTQICRLTESWPDLEDLELTWPCSESSTGLLDTCFLGLYSLSALASHCRKLHRLKLSFLDVGDIPHYPLVPPSAAVVQLELQYGFLDVREEELDEIAAFLSMIWPRVSFIGPIFRQEEDWRAMSKAHRLMGLRLNMEEERRQALALQEVRTQWEEAMAELFTA